MRQSVRLGRIVGIPIGMHWTVVVIAALITDMLAAGWLPAKPMPGMKMVYTPDKESHVLNDAILGGSAQDLAHRSRQDRKVIFVISDGQELGSRASYAQVLKVLLTTKLPSMPWGRGSGHAAL